MNINYKELDKSYLPAVYRLAHDANVRAGHINPKPDLFFIQNRALDESENTAIIGAYEEAELVGTCSVTANSQHGLLADRHFPEEYGRLLFNHARLGAFWRLAVKPGLKSNTHIIIGLIRAALLKAQNMGIEKLVYMCTDDHAQTYQKLVGAETVAHKIIQFEAQSVDASLMLLDVGTGLDQIQRGKDS